MREKKTSNNANSTSKMIINSTQRESTRLKLKSHKPQYLSLLSKRAHLHTPKHIPSLSLSQTHVHDHKLTQNFPRHFDSRYLSSYLFYFYFISLSLSTFSFITSSPLPHFLFILSYSLSHLLPLISLNPSFLPGILSHSFILSLISVFVFYFFSS